MRHTPGGHCEFICAVCGRAGTVFRVLDAQLCFDHYDVVRDATRAAERCAVERLLASYAGPARTARTDTIASSQIAARSERSSSAPDEHIASST